MVLTKCELCKFYLASWEALIFKDNSYRHAIICDDCKSKEETLSAVELLDTDIASG